MTPWHVLREYPTEQEAKMAAYWMAKDREGDAIYPEYQVNGVRF